MKTLSQKKHFFIVGLSSLALIGAFTVFQNCSDMNLVQEDGGPPDLPSQDVSPNNSAEPNACDLKFPRSIRNDHQNPLTWIWEAPKEATSYVIQVKNFAGDIVVGPLEISQPKYKLSSWSHNQAYRIEVKAKCANGTESSDWSYYKNTSAPPQNAPLGHVVNITTQNVTAKTITWSWEALHGATHYLIHIYWYADGTRKRLVDKWVTSTSFDLTDARSNRKYDFAIKGYNAQGFSVGWQAFPDRTLSPNVSTQNFVFPDYIRQNQNNRRTWRWTAPSGATSYIVRVRNSKGNIVSGPTETTQTYYSFSPFYAFRVYTIEIKAKNASGAQSPTWDYRKRTALTEQGSSTRILPDVANVRTTSVSPTSITWQWDQLQDARNKYLINIYVYTADGSSRERRIVSKWVTGTSYTLNNAMSGRKYDLAIKGVHFNNAGISRNWVLSSVTAD